MRLGIDFGSTYSTLAHFNRALNNVETITMAEGTPASIPSVVSIARKSKTVTCGDAAKAQIGKKTVRIFEAFKMLLTESNPDILRQRGYDETYTPREITRLYLESVLKTALLREGETEVEELVICVPEIWGKRVTTLDGRMILRDLLRREISVPVGHVQVVTEPEAASAYFAYNYERETGKRFNGHLLLIDYGGGTLDITLTEVFSDGHGSMEIGYREGGGAGENHPGEHGESVIGSAGIAYMQSVLVLALREGGLLPGGEAPDYTAPDFVAAVRDLESQLKSAERMKEIEDFFGTYGSYRKMKRVLKEERVEFCSVEYSGEEVPVYYHQLFAAYQQTIAGVLAEQVREINEKVRRHIDADPCEPDAGAKDDFKIALVGGFGSFYLVKQQIAEIYHLDTNSKTDPRTKNITANKREQAISLGAALLAEGKIVLQKTARYSIGLCTKNAKGRVTGLYYGIRYHQNIEPGKPYYLLSRPDAGDKPENRVTWAALYGNIESFVIEFTDRLDHGGLMDVKPEILERLRQLPDFGFWNCGFSMDENDVVSFHVTPRPIPGLPDQREGIVIPLDSYSRMFDLTAVREVTV